MLCSSRSWCGVIAVFAAVTVGACFGPIPGGGGPTTPDAGSAVATLMGLALSADTVSAGGSVQGTVSLSGPAVAPGLVVTITSSAPFVVSTPLTVDISAGQRVGAFVARASPPVGVRQTVTLTASANGVSKTATITVVR